MNLRSALSVAVVVSSIASSFATSGCSSAVDAVPVVESGAPVLDSVDAPESVPLVNGTYTVTLGLRFHDPDNDAVTKVRFRIPAGNLDQTQAIDNAGPNVTEATVAIQIGGMVPKQTYEFAVSVIDAKGTESAPITRSLTLN